MPPSDSNELLWANLFGGLSVATQNGTPIKFRTKKTAALFAYLAFFHDVPHNREILADLFWPESNLDSGRQNLRMALSSLRSSLESTHAVIESDRISVSLQNIKTDVDTFVEATQTSFNARTWLKSFEAIRGPLLAGFDDEWIISQWLQLEEAYAQAVVKCLELADSLEDKNDAVIAGKRAVALLGPREDVHIALMKLYVELGKPSLALAQFEELERQLESQWGEQPSQAACDALNLIPKGTSEQVPTATPKVKPIPAARSSILGRDQDIEALVQLISSSGGRLFSLYGPGGSGKTTLSVELARRLADSFDGRLWIAPLASVRNADRVANEVASLMTEEPEATDPFAAIEKVVGGRPALVVLDNLEHLLPAGKEFVARLLGLTPLLKVIVTTRILLEIEGEYRWPVQPLEIPTPNLNLKQLREISSVSLFCERALAVQHDFTLNTGNATAISEICRRLEGLPLAIELAASKLATYSPAEILARLSHSVDFLSSRRQDVSERHKSLRATLDWSYRLLNDNLKGMFASCSVFSQGFNLAASQSICDPPMSDDDMAELVQSSLIIATKTDHATRFRLLEPIREYALGVLSEDQLQRVKRRHFEFYYALANGENIGEPSAKNRAWLDALHDDNENLLVAFEGYLDGTCSPSEAIDLAKVLHPFFRPRGHTNTWFAALLRFDSSLTEQDLPAVRLESKINLALTGSNIADGQQTMNWFLEALELAQGSDDHSAIARVNQGLGGGYKSSGQYEESLKFYRDAVESFKHLQDDARIASTLRQMSMTYVSMNDHEKCYELLKESEPYARKSGDPDIIAWTLTDLGVEHAIHGLTEESEQCFSEAHDACRVSGSQHMQSIVYWQQAEAQLRTNRMEESVTTHLRSIKCALAADFKEGLKWIMLSAGIAFAQSGQHEFGIRLMARTARWRQDAQRVLTGDEIEILEPAKAICKEAMGENKFQLAWGKGEQEDLDPLIDEVHLMALALH